jgi:hypothetical protein
MITIYESSFTQRRQLPFAIRTDQLILYPIGKTVNVENVLARGQHEPELSHHIRRCLSLGLMSFLCLWSSFTSGDKGIVVDSLMAVAAFTPWLGFK